MTDFMPQKGLSAEEIETLVEAVLREITLDEKVAMMSGQGFFQQLQANGFGADPYRAGGGCERLGIDPFYFTDGPRGVVRGRSTAFPCTMARGASFDPDLERRIGEAMAIETRAQGCNLSGAVCINLLRHPAWGRAQETYGEDPWHLGEMGAALAQGLQTHNVCATVKHFALNSIENARFKVDVQVDPRTLREVYLPHFKRVIDAGCASVMSAYNKVNGEFCGQNRALLTDILRHEWGFTGFVHSDWVLGVRAAYGASAGLDVENPEPLIFGEKLVAAVEAGHVEPQVIDTACRRILTTFYRFACAEDPLPAYTQDLVACPSHRALALEAAEKSAVLLKNDQVLPLSRSRVRTLAVLGRLARIANTGDFGSSRVQAPYVVTPHEGLAETFGDQVTLLEGDESDPAEAAHLAGQADAAVVIVGYTAREEGEFIPGDLAQQFLPEGAGAQSDPTSEVQSIGGDRDSLALSPDQVRLIEAACAANPKTIVVVMAGSAVIMEDWRGQAGAILQTFYSGMEGGRALARLIAGLAVPSGKLPFTVPRSADDLPHFDKDADQITYGPYHGYTLFDRDGTQPAYPFGHGLSYSRFSYRALTAWRQGEEIAVTVSVTNDGDWRCDEVVQVYVGFPGEEAVRPRKLLRGFRRITITPGETLSVRIAVPLDSLAWYDPSTRVWRHERGLYTVFAGGSSDEAALVKTTLRL